MLGDKAEKAHLDKANPEQHVQIGQAYAQVQLQDGRYENGHVGATGETWVAIRDAPAIREYHVAKQLYALRRRRQFGHDLREC